MSSSDNGYCTLVPLLNALGDYEKKGVGVDMMLKSVLGFFRLAMLYSSSAADKKRYAAIADAIIECRMLCNFGRPAMTFHQGMKIVKLHRCMEFWHWLFSCLSFFFRVPEQLSGDLNYLQKVIFHQWSREKLSFYYRFFKSLSLTCCLCVELARRPSLTAALNTSVPDHLLHAKLELKVSNALIIRTLCDMYVYYKWIPWWNPNRTMEYTCGSVSGLIGVWLVWKDTRYILPPRSPPAEAPCSPCERQPLHRAVRMMDNEGCGSEGGSAADA